MLNTYFVLLIFVGLSVSAQTNITGQATEELENKIEELSLFLLDQQSDFSKDSANAELKQVLSKALAKEEAFSHSFEKVKSLTILTPSDSSFRLFNWSIPYEDGSFKYECILLRKKEKKKNELIFLISSTEYGSNEEEELITRTSSNWMGGLYYQIIQKQTKFNTYYTLLAWDGNNLLTNKKIIDVLWFTEKGEVKFGAPLFKSNKKTVSRIIFEFGGQHAMKLTYIEKADQIIFDYLVPLNPRLEGVYEYYYPDVTQDAYLWDNGMWVFQKLVDGDEHLKKFKRNFPAYNKETIQEQNPIYSPPK